MTPEHKAILIASNIGKVRSEEHKAKIRAANLGRKMSAESNAKKSVALKNRYFSPEHRRKISEAMKGRKLSPERNAQLHAGNVGRVLTPEHKAKLFAHNLGNKLSEETRKKISATRIVKFPRKCNKPYSVEWTELLRETIRTRDKYTCQKCLSPQIEIRSKRKLHVHHINHDKSNCSESNLITLCNECHSHVHCYMIDYWIKFFTELIQLNDRTAAISGYSTSS
jgi:5-methylcytosine-specific restriction endonuclease McrA